MFTFKILEDATCPCMEGSVDSLMFWVMLMASCAAVCRWVVPPPAAAAAMPVPLIVDRPSGEVPRDL